MNTHSALRTPHSALRNLARLGLLLLITAAFTPLVLATTYYSAGTTGDPTSVNSWWTVNNGTGAGTGTHPANFTSGDTFEILSGCTYTATVAWTVNATTAGTAATVQIDSGATLNMNILALSLGGNFVKNGTFNGGSSGMKITFTSNGTWTGSGDISGQKNQITVNSGVTLDASGISDAGIKFISSGTVAFSVSGILNMGTKTINGNGDTSASFTLGSSGTLITANTSASGVPGIIIGFSAGKVTLPTTANYTFNGTAAQVTGTTANNATMPATVNNLTINNTAGVTLSQATTATTLTLTAGKLNTTAINLLTIGSAGSITGGSSGSFVNGPLARAYSATGSKTFPVGQNSNYRAVSVNLTTLSGTPTLTVTPKEPASVGGTTPVGYSLWPTRSWTIASSVASGNTATLTVDGTGFSTALTPALLDYNGTSQTALSTTFSSPNYSATGVGLTAASDIGIGCPAPAAPGQPSVSAPSCAPVTVTWDNTISGAGTYNVYRKLSGGSYGAALATGQTGPSYADNTAAVGNTYVYAVTAVSDCGAESISKSPDSLGATPTGAPVAPVISSVTPGCGSLTVNWGTVSGDSGGYNIYRKLSGGSYGAAIASVASGVGTYADNTATDGTKTYVYAVTGVGGCESVKSSDSSGATPNVPPSITTSPANFVFYDGVAGQQATFTVVAAGPGLTYQWQVNTGSGWNNVVEGVDGTGSASPTLTVASLISGMSGYQYKCVVSGTCSPAATSSAATLSLGTQFRSLATGNWAANTSWQISADGTTWYNAQAGVYPGATVGHADTVTIRAHTITAAVNNNAGSVALTDANSILYINDSVTLTVAGAVSTVAGSKIGMGSGTVTAGQLSIGGNFANAGTITFAAGGSASSSGRFIFTGTTTWSGVGDISLIKCGITVNVGATLTLQTDIKERGNTGGSAVFIYGRLNAGTYKIYGQYASSGVLFTMGTGATLETANAGGMGGVAATSGTWQPANSGGATASINSACNFIFDGAASQTVGTAFPATVNNLTIANSSGAVSLGANLTVNGTLTVNAGASLDFNSFDITTPNAPSLLGALTMEVTKTGLNTFTGSKLTQTAGTLTYGGTLAVTTGGPALSYGESIPLFVCAGGFGGGFSSVTGPTVGSGLTANTSQLTGGTGGNLTIGGTGVYVPNLAYTNAPGLARIISLTEIQAAGLASSQSSPSYSVTGVSSPSTAGGVVIYNASNIKYTYPTSGSPAGDTFTYTISDGTSSATATVSITFQSVVGPQISPSGNDGNGHPVITFHGLPNYTYHFQRSPDMTTWTTLNPGVTCDGTGNATWTDNANDPVPDPSVFYRLSYP